MILRLLGVLRRLAKHHLTITTASTAFKPTTVWSALLR